MASTDSEAAFRRERNLNRRLSFQRLKPAVKSLLPTPALRWIQRQRKAAFTPPCGKVDFGDLRRLTPMSRSYGYDRGRPIDRYFIEKFLQSNAGLIRGRVLEIGESIYTRAFGGTHVTRSDVFHAYEAPGATIVGDLANMAHVPANTFDCMIITQTLHLIYDIRAALSEIHRVLKPGGVMLATFPGLSQISDNEWRPSWYWGFTAQSASRLVCEVFPPTHVDIRSRGNVLVSAAFLFGLADTELTKEELEFDDPDYQTIITAKVRKPTADERYPMMGRWDYGEAEPFAYDAEESYRKGMAYLDGHGTVEDWGCGTAYAKRFVKASKYIGVDGSQSRFVDTVADLQTYRSDVDCIFMRHVLEHNYGWRLILQNAVQSFRERMVLILFTPFAEHERKAGEHDRKIGDNDGIPDLSLRRDEIVAFFDGLSFTEETLDSNTEYGRERIFYIRRS
jgi:SAM-dependent methyltransferase